MEPTPTIPRARVVGNAVYLEFPDPCHEVPAAWSEKDVEWAEFVSRQVNRAVRATLFQAAEEALACEVNVYGMEVSVCRLTVAKRLRELAEPPVQEPADRV